MDLIDFDFNIEKFLQEIEDLMTKDLDFLEAIVQWCDSKDFEIETIIPIIKKDADLKARLFEAASRKNFLKK